MFLISVEMTDSASSSSPIVWILIIFEGEEEEEEGKEANEEIFFEWSRRESIFNARFLISIPNPKPLFVPHQT